MRPSWDEYFMALAEQISRRSPDPSTRHGCVLVDAVPSNWLLLCTGALALFLSLAKRRHELVLLDASAGDHRRIA